jgi:peptidoglycan/xylan/chitin deacetylase (PgdA/CDA1 family)
MNRFRTPVLMLHHVEPDPRQLAPAPVFRDSYLSRGELAALLDLLAERGYHTWTLCEAAARAASGLSLPRKSVVLTFDDGCRCFRDHAQPELQARGMTATLFAVSGALGGTNRWDRGPGSDRRAHPGPGSDPDPGSDRHALPDPSEHEPDSPTTRPVERREELLTATALRALAAGGIEIGSHSRRHRDLTRCSARELADEVTGSREELAAALGQPVRTFCYPYGRLDAPARAAVSSAGYLAAAALSSREGARAGDLYALPRLAIRPGESRFEQRLKITGLYGPWSRFPRLGVLRALRRGGVA